MASGRHIEIKMAKLHPDQIERYEQLHNEMPEQNIRHMQEGGIVSLRIFRDGLTLFMIVETDSSLALQGRYIDQAVEEEWQRLTGAFFAVMWEDASEIFTFNRKKCWI